MQVVAGLLAGLHCRRARQPLGHDAAQELEALRPVYVNADESRGSEHNRGVAMLASVAKERGALVGVGERTGLVPAARRDALRGIASSPAVNATASRSPP